jgi:hypothetical protein
MPSGNVIPFVCLYLSLLFYTFYRKDLQKEDFCLENIDILLENIGLKDIRLKVLKKLSGSNVKLVFFRVSNA